MLNQVSYTFIMLQEAVFWNFILKFIFLFWIKMAFDYSKQPSLKKIKALKHTGNSVVKIMLLLLVFIIPFSGCRNVFISYPKAYWLGINFPFDPDYLFF